MVVPTRVNIICRYKYKVYIILRRVGQIPIFFPLFLFVSLFFALFLFLYVSVFDSRELFKFLYILEYKVV